MDKLFYEDQYIKEFTTDIVDIEEKDGTYHVALDRTAFFPGGGGQFCDLGRIDSSEVIDVYEENGVIYHVIRQKPLKTHNLKCFINWERRQDGMDQHLAQHVLSGCFFKLFNANTSSFHLGTDISTVDIKGYLEEEKIRTVEEYANKMISENIVVESFVPPKAELQEINLRRDLPKTDEDIRVVKIGDLDINACCGVHPKSTGALRMIKIGRWQKHKDDTRIEFLSGSRAIEDVLKKDRTLTEICRCLSSKDQEAIKSIKNLKKQLKVTLDENKRLIGGIALYETKALTTNAEKIGNYSLITKIYDEYNVKYANKLVAKLVQLENNIVLMAVKDGENANLIFATSNNIKNIRMNDLLNETMSLIEGRGGGNQVLAQGRGKVSNLNSAMNYAIMKLKNNLIL